MSVIARIVTTILSIILVGGFAAGVIDMIKNRKSKHKPAGVYEAFFKRVIDFICGMLVLVILWPLYLILAVTVRIKLGSPILFTQKRPGKDEKLFKLYKFRTMTDEKDENGELLSDDKRLTSFGSWLRKSSMDEIFEVFNIVRGDMSLVGPRPLLVRYLPFYTDEERDRHSVKPGLTGLAQINGRNSLEWSERFKLDCDYAHNITFITDVKIIIGTFYKVLKKVDVTDDGDYLLKNLDEERGQ